MKMKRHVSLEKRNAQKTEEVKQKNSEQKKDCKGAKRNVPCWSKEQIQVLKDSLSAFQENDAAYENLKNVLNNMGLFQNMVKRETVKVEKDSEEDENINNSGIVLQQNVKKRNGEEEGVEKRQAKEEDKREGKSDSKRKSEENRSVLTEKEHREGDRKRRENEGDLIKSLEKSGEVSLSGNKSPLAKNEISSGDAERKRDTSEDEDYDQKIESEIQAKIDAIKEKVKREILMEKQKRQNSRSKRALTLLDSETKNINPELTSYDSLKPHIRIRRYLNETLRHTNSTKNSTIPSIFSNTTLEDTYEELYENSSNDSMKPHKRVRREAKNENTVNLKVKKRETRDSTLTSRKKRANNLAENKMLFHPYLSQQDEDEESENNEFDNLYDQQYVEKREAFDPDYQYFEKEDSQEFQAQDKSPGYSESLHPVKRQSRSHLSEEEHYEPYIRPRNRYRYKVFRDKRENEKGQLHSGMVSRKLARNKELVDDRGKRGNMDDEESVESDNEFFGALPQNYQEGELNRYKRIKRNGPVKKPES